MTTHPGKYETYCSSTAFWVHIVHTLIRHDRGSEHYGRHRELDPLDEVDRSLIRALVADGRISMLELSKRAHVSRTHLYSRIERLQQAAIVEGFTARINLAKQVLPPRR